MIEYTLDYHVQRLKEMLERNDPCKCCPKMDLWDYNSPLSNLIPTFTDQEEICEICRNFVEVEDIENCPCFEFSREKAIEKTLLAIEEYDNAKNNT